MLQLPAQLLPPTSVGLLPSVTTTTRRPSWLANKRREATKNWLVNVERHTMGHKATFSPV
jgi:hypothetical protein